MAACCLYGAFLMGCILRKYEVFQSFRLSDPILELDTETPQKRPQAALSGLDRLETLTVGGMTCSSCSNAVHCSLSKLDGMKRANVDILQGSVQVVYDCTRTQANHIRQAIEDAGFTTSSKIKSVSHEETLTQRLSRRNYGDAFTWSLFCLIPIFGLEASPASIIDERRRRLYILVLAGFVQVGFGLPFHRRTWLTFSKSLPTPMDVLVSASTKTAYVASLIFYLQDDSTRYATIAASLISVLSLGKHLESHARTSISDTIKAFTESVPSEARVVSSEGTTTVLQVQMLRDGDLVSVSSGQRFPCDGKLFCPPSGGYADNVEVDESFHTGEALPVVRSAGDTCLAGTVNSGRLPALIEIRNAQESTARLEQTMQALLES